MPYTIPSSVISPGAVYQPRQRPILNRIPGAIAAWSTRRLISSAPADIARGRDATTTEQDFTAAELAGTGFTDLAGAGDGFYVTLYDQIGNNNATQSTAASQPKGVSSGTLITNGATPVPLYDGANDALISADNISFNWSTNLSISCWAKSSLTSITATSDYFFGKYDYGSNQREIALGLDVNSKIELVIGSNAGATANEWNSTSSIPNINSWNHYCLVYSGIAIKVFVNGLEIAGSFVVGSLPGTLVNGTADFSIGSILNSGVNVLNWEGQLNDVIIFNRALSAAEVLKLYTALI